MFHYFSPAFVVVCSTSGGFEGQLQKVVVFFQWEILVSNPPFKPTENPQLLEPTKKHKKSREKGRDFQSFISGVVDSPNPETPMFRSSEWYHLWQPVSENVFWGQILQTNESDLMEKLFGPFFGRWGTTTTHRLLFGGKFRG